MMGHQLRHVKRMNLSGENTTVASKLDRYLIFSVEC